MKRDLKDKVKRKSKMMQLKLKTFDIRYNVLTVLNRLGRIYMRLSHLSNVRMKAEDLVMFKSLVKCHNTENFTWAFRRIP